MANLLDIEPVYISLEDYKGTTSVEYLETASDEELKAIIYNAQKVIDEYIVAWGLPCVEGQEFIFPTTLVDATCEVPNDIAIATVYVWDKFYTNQDASSSANNVKIDKSWPRTIEYFESAQDSDTFIDQKTRIILDRYSLSHLNISI